MAALADRLGHREVRAGEGPTRDALVPAAALGREIAPVPATDGDPAGERTRTGLGPAAAGSRPQRALRPA
ncbi:hypothetical protein ASE41_24970 [Streptomyces sp. Root264]|nr:hypothetical protein ASE41_24970 [Streptomyces sp. Root264]